MKTDGFHPHLWTGEVGKRAFVNLGNDIYLSMPAFVFVQMAPRLSFVDLVMLGMMFCGYYSPGSQFGRSEKNGNLDAPLSSLHKQMVCSAQVFELEPVCTERALKAFIDNHCDIHGITAARKALPWVRNNAASHMETALYLLLCLPVRLGGYSISKPVLNAKVIVEQASGTITCFPDLYWVGQSIDIEYASDWAHATISGSYKDSRRMTAIVCNHITYLSITTGQLKRLKDMDNAARGLARLLGHRIRNTDAKWEKRRAALRTAVLPTDFEIIAPDD